MIDNQLPIKKTRAKFFYASGSMIVTAVFKIVKLEQLLPVFWKHKLTPSEEVGSIFSSNRNFFYRLPR